MKSLTDEYNLNEKSKTGLFGFEIFQLADNDFYYFHFNDKDGKAVLFSQGYSKLSSCENGIRSVMKNMLLEERYESVNDGENWYLTIKAGNHQQITRSGNAKTEKELDRLKSSLLAAGEDLPINERLELTAKKDSAEPTKKATAKPLKSVEAPHCQRFTISVYSDSGTIRLEHVFSKKHDTLKKLESEKIAAFIAANLPDEWKEQFLSEKLNDSAAEPSTVAKVSEPSSEQLQAELDGAMETGLDFSQMKGVVKLESSHQEEFIAPEEEKIEKVEKKPKQEGFDVVMDFITSDTEAMLKSNKSSVKEIRAILRRPTNNPVTKQEKDVVLKLVAEPKRNQAPKKYGPIGQPRQSFFGVKTAIKNL